MKKILKSLVLIIGLLLSIEILLCSCANASGTEKASEGSDEVIDTEGHEFIKSAAEEKAETLKSKLDNQLESTIANATDISTPAENSTPNA